MEQCRSLPEGEKIEILLWDDGSTHKYANAATAERLPQVRYQESETNRGRAATRNALIQQAKGEYLLFLDADMLPDREDFLSLYLEQGRAGRDIVCGGISYLQKTDSASRSSFYLYKSHRCEALSADVRNGAPWRYFFTSNIMVRRTIVESVPFDTRFTGYGFEDIEWGLRLGQSYCLKHIENACSHMGLMANEEVFFKMRDSITNYALLLSLHPEVATVGAPRIATVLKRIPDVFLTRLDALLGLFFRYLSWNPLLFILFQADKAVLLAREMKKTTAER